MLTLHIGNKNYSSWSLRPWLALKWADIPFEEHVIPLGGEGYGSFKIREVLAVSPSGRVPALRDDELVVYESLAICEWAAERVPSLWPENANTRAEARSVACEMHSGFAAVRRDLSMNIRRRLPSAPPLKADTREDLDRLFHLWGDLRSRYGARGPFLFGARSIADAMFAPVATRLRTYAIECPTAVRAYCEEIFADPSFLEWERAAIGESWVIQQTEALYRD
jgi:glutathione S-transferase